MNYICVYVTYREVSIFSEGYLAGWQEGRGETWREVGFSRSPWGTTPLEAGISLTGHQTWSKTS